MNNILHSVGYGLISALGTVFVFWFFYSFVLRSKISDEELFTIRFVIAITFLITFCSTL